MGKTKSYKSMSRNRITHFDENGNKVGVSYKSTSGKRITHFDASGNKTGTSWGNDYGRFRHYDNNGVKLGTSYQRPSGIVRHFDEKTGKSSTIYRSFLGGYVTDTSSNIEISSKNTSVSSTSEDYSTAIIGCLSPFLIWGIAFFIAQFFM